MDSGDVSYLGDGLSVPARAVAAAAAAGRVELEAAQALAGLASWAQQEPASDSAAKWGSKGKRVRRRVKSESPPSDLDNKLLPIAPDPDRATISQQRNHDVSDNPYTKPMKGENVDGVFERNFMSTTRDTPNGGGRSRQNLSEAEKEARRLRRILANRESARQTIRRRQALCEELRQKTADLTRENEDLIKEKEMVLTQYQTLEKTNKLLKRKMVKVLKAERGETSKDVRTCDPMIPTTNTPMFLYNQHPFPPFFCPSMYQSSSHAVQPQQGFQSPTPRVSSDTAVPIPTRIRSSHNQESPLNINCQNGPFYIVPCPWFFSHPENGKGFLPQLSGCRDLNDDEVCMNNSCTAAESSSRIIPHVESNRPSSPLKVENSIEVREIDLNAFPVKHYAEGETCGFPSEENHEANNMEEKKSGAIISTSVGTALTLTRDPIPDYFRDGVSNMAAAVSTIDQSASALPEEKKESVNYVSRKVQDQHAAALARRRRRELTKTKESSWSPMQDALLMLKRDGCELELSADCSQMRGNLVKCTKPSHFAYT